MTFIKKIFENKLDEQTHRIFSRFGKGDYDNRALVEVNIGSKINVKTSFEFSNDLFEMILNLIDKGKLKGKIISNEDFEKEVDSGISNYSKRGKLYTTELDCEVDSKKMRDIYERFKLKSILLNVNSDKLKLICKNSLPKPGGVVKNDFCKLTCEKEFKDLIIKEFAFDVGVFKKLVIIHEFIIEDLVVPKEYEKDPSKARYSAKRKGKIIRKINLDGKEIIKEKEIEV